VLNTLLRRLLRTPRVDVWRDWYRSYDENPFGVDPASVSRERFLDLAARARERRNEPLLTALRERFGGLPAAAFVDELALATQVVPKDEELDWSHGFLLYAALTSYVERTGSDRPVTILETGTARGFSAVCMAKALRDAERAGTILTVDVLHAERPIYWNSIADADGRKTRLELLEPWSDLVEDHVVFVRGDVSVALEQIGLARIHFAFLDAEHTYDAVRSELAFVAAHQRPGDVIVCDDYTPREFPEIVRAVDELAAAGTYILEPFVSSDDRGYAYLQKS
jgi:predicted O-methyltransferase YrrM